MALKRTLIIETVEIVVNELSVSQVREWLKNNDSATNPDLIDSLLFEDFVLSDLACFTNLTGSIIDTMPPSDLRKVVDCIRELNPHFFGLRDRLVEMGKEYLKTLPNAS